MSKGKVAQELGKPKHLIISLVYLVTPKQALLYLS